MAEFFKRWILKYNKFWAFVISAALGIASQEFGWTFGVKEDDVLYVIGLVGAIVVRQIPNIDPDKAQGP